MNAFPKWFRLPRYAGPTVLAVLTATCTSGPFATDGATVATQLAFTVNPGSAVAGAAFAPAVVVEARDASGRLASSFTGDVTMVIGTNPSAGILSGTLTVAAVAGRATFANLRIDKVGSGYSLNASFGALAPATSAAFSITPAAASQFVFTVQPTSTTAGASIGPPIKVTALDAFGNTATSFARNVSLALGAHPTGATMWGTTTATAVGGVATFSAARIDKSGANYTLVATAVGVTEATSAPFNVDAGPAATLAFTQEPSVARWSCPAGLTIAPFRLTVTDAFGNAVVSDTREVQIALGSDPVSSRGNLSGTTTAAAVAGVAAFSDLTIDGSGMWYRLVATASGLAAATSSPFGFPSDACWGPLTFSVQPTSTGAGAVITPAVVVTARDGQGGTNTGFNGNVTIAIGSNPAGGTLSGTTTRVAVAGVATFPNLSLNRAGAGYTLTASATGLTSVASRPFSIFPGPEASQLTFSVQPTNTVAGTAITPAVVVIARDNQGNTAPITGNVTIAIGTNPSSGTLSGTTTVAAAAGVATFPVLSLNRTGTGYTLTASAAGVTGATSSAFTIVAGSATQLVCSGGPSQLRVTAVDDLGNTVTSFTGAVTAVLNPGGGAVTVSAVAGVATFANLSIPSGASVVATSGALTVACGPY